MGFQVSPGVKVTERDLTSIIPAVATTPAGIVGQFKWGPAEQRIVVSSENDLYQLFGSPDIDTFPYFFSAANFLQYGNNIQVVRGVSGDAINAVASNNNATGASAYLIKNRDDYDGSYDVNDGGYSTNRSAYFAARYPGSLGNSLRIEACDGLSAFNVWSLSGNFSSPPGTSQYVTNLNGSQSAGDEIHIAVIDEDGVFSGITGTILELYEGLSKATDARKGDGNSNYYKRVINETSAYAYWLNHINGVSTHVSTGTGNYGTISGTAAGSPVGLGATDGLYIGQFTGGSVGTNPNQSQIAALYSTYFGDADNVDVSLLLGGPLIGAPAATVAQVASGRKDCVAFFSSPNSNPLATSTTKLGNCTTLKNAIGSNSYAFIDSGYKYQYDRYNDTYRWVPLNGDIAGLCARTDETNDPWWSPAGFNRGSVRGVIKLGFNPSATDRDIIYPKGINPVVTFPGDGTVLYGDRTAQTKPSAFDRINVRRLFIVLEKAISIAAKYQLFEFNDAFTRSSFLSMVTPFLRDVQARRGIYDFKVICDETNNTAEVIDSNRFVADLYIKPARTINFIQLSFIATRTGVNFEEVATLSIPGN